MKVGVLGAGVMGARDRAGHRDRGLRDGLLTTSTPARSSTRSGARHHRAVRVRARRRARQADAGGGRRGAGAPLVHRRRSTRPRTSTSWSRRCPRSSSSSSRSSATSTPPRRAGTILASNTSGFPIGQIAEVTTRPELVIGWHWASPPAVMRLAEIVRGPVTSDATADDRRRARHRVRQEPRRHHTTPRRRVGLRRQPRVHGDDPGSERVRRRGHRHARAGRHADGRLLPLAGRPLRHGAGRDERLGPVAQHVRRHRRPGRAPARRLPEPTPHPADGLVARAARWCGRPLRGSASCACRRRREARSAATYEIAAKPSTMREQEQAHLLGERDDRRSCRRSPTRAGSGSRTWRRRDRALHRGRRAAAGCRSRAARPRRRSRS